MAAFDLLHDVEVVAVCTARADVDAASLARAHGRPIEVVRELDDLLARPDIEIVDLCSRSNLHARQGVAVARAGKHLIIEKPIALSLSDMRALQDAVAASGVRTCVCFEVRFSPQFTATKSLLQGDLIGPLHYAEVDYYHDVGPSFAQYEWNRLRDGGGSSLLSAGCHAVDGLLMFMADPPIEVVSFATRSPHPDFVRYEYPTTSVTLVRFASGAIGKVASVLDAFQPYYLRVHLVGSHGTLLDGRFWSSRIEGLDPDRWTEIGVALESSADVAEHPYLPQFRAFIDALEADREMPLTSLAEAARSFEVVFAADRSAELGRAVQIEELRA
jgi:predicted dehydrogenase